MTENLNLQQKYCSYPHGSVSNPLRRALFGLGAVLQHSHTPSLRVTGFEDEDDDEDSLPDEALSLSTGSSVNKRSRENEALVSKNESH